MSNQDRIRRQQRFREAEGYLDLATCLSERWPLDLASRLRLGRRAVRTLDQLDTEGRGRPRAQCLRGQAFLLMEKYGEAIRCFRQAALCDDENVHIWLALGACYRKTDRLDLAIQALEQAAAIDYCNAAVQYKLACYWSLLGKVEPAVRHLGRAIDQDARFRERAFNDADFDLVRRDPLFLAATTASV